MCQSYDVPYVVRCEEGSGRNASIMKEEITTLKERVSTAESLLQETARALEGTGLEVSQLVKCRLGATQRGMVMIVFTPCCP